MILRRLRHRWWTWLGDIANALAQRCFKRRARLCPGPCFYCYLVLNGERIAKDAVADAMRAARGDKPVDRRPS